MKRGWVILVPVAVAGGLTGLWLGSPPVAREVAKVDTRTGRDSSRSRPGTTRDPQAERSFAALMRQLDHSGGIPAMAQRSVESASSEELRATLLGISAEKLPGRFYGAEPVKRMASLKAAASELFRREGVKCLEWTLPLENSDLSLAVMIAAGEQDPALMKQWLVKFGAHWEPWAGSSAIAAAERKAAMTSAEDLLKVEALFSDSLNSSPSSFAEGFDFRGYLKATQSQSGGEKAYRCWAAQDPAAAAQGLLEGLGNNPYNRAADFLLPAMAGRAEMSNDDEAAAWICSVVADLDGQARQQAIAALVGHRKPSPLLLRHLPTEEDRLAFAATSLSRDHASEGATAVLKALPSPAAQMEAVRRWVEGTGDLAAHELDGVMERLDFPEDQREVLRAKVRPTPY